MGRPLINLIDKYIYAELLNNKFRRLPSEFFVLIKAKASNLIFVTFYKEVGA